MQLSHNFVESVLEMTEVNFRSPELGGEGKGWRQNDKKR